MIFWKNRNHEKIMVPMLNIGVPLMVGFMIYILFSPSSIVTQYFWNIVGIENPFQMVKNSDLPFCLQWMRYYLCDGLWAYSLTWAIYYILSYMDFISHKILTSCLISFLFALSLELLQLIQVTNGIYDWFDVFAYVLFVFCAGTVIFILRSKGVIN